MLYARGTKEEFLDFIEWLNCQDYYHDNDIYTWGKYEDCNWVFVDTVRKVYAYGKPGVGLTTSPRIDFETAKQIILNTGESDIVKKIKKFCEHKDQYRIYENYVGWCMNFRTCLGVVVRDGFSYAEFLVELTKYIDEQMPGSVMNKVCVDDLGFDKIVYFPRIRG
jgi:hypothetical protein